MHLIISVCLPRDRASIPVTRHIIRDALGEVGVSVECTQDVLIAQSEACTNVIEHSGPGDEYEVRVDIDGDKCVLSVIDTGHGFDSTAVALNPDEDSERGRGIQLMRALVDDVHFVSDPDSGTVVHLEKALHFRDDAVFRGA
jgi:serine/threonine-protein kinase RsbW